MGDWPIPGDHTVSKNYGSNLDISSAHMDYKAQRLFITLEARNGAGEWQGPKVTVEVTVEGTTITKYDGEKLSFSPKFNNVNVQGLLDKATVVSFVSTRVADPRA